jgi:hypothetical protein
VRRALRSVFGGEVGKDTVSRVWRKVKGDWDTWNCRSLADEPIVRLILDGTVVPVRLDRKATSISLLVVNAAEVVEHLGGEFLAAHDAALQVGRKAVNAVRAVRAAKLGFVEMPRDGGSEGVAGDTRALEGIALKLALRGGSGCTIRFHVDCSFLARAACRCLGPFSFSSTCNGGVWRSSSGI